MISIALASGALPVLIAPSLAGAQAMTPEGGGPYPAIIEKATSLPGHLIYRPANLASLSKGGLGIYIFGNGACSADATSSREHLIEIASNGYLVLVPGDFPPENRVQRPAPQPGARLTSETRAEALIEALDWAIRENAREGSTFHDKIAVDQVALSGFSCGGLQALMMADDPRVKTTIVMNSGVYNDEVSRIDGIVARKSYLERLRGSALYVLGGTTDIAYPNGMDDYRRINHIPVAVANIPVGHGGTYRQPNGGVGAAIVIDWLNWKLKGQPEAGDRFSGANCFWCGDARITFEAKNM